MFFPFFMSNFMQIFIINNDIINNQSIEDECTLSWGHNMVKDMCYLFCNCFNYNPIKDITQAYPSKICNLLWFINFLDQNNVRLIKRSNYISLIQDIEISRDDIKPY